MSNLIKIGSGIQKLIDTDIEAHTHRQQGHLISLVLFLEPRKIC
jgi:hypothetical protein